MAQGRALEASMIVKNPSPGDRVLIFKPQFLQLILGGAKTLEIRAAPYKSGTYLFGCRGQIYGQANLGRAYPIHSMRDFERTRSMHRMKCSRLPYQKTFAIPILEFKEMCAQYRHPRGKSLL